MPQNPIETRPPSTIEHFLQQKFAEEQVKQSERLDDLAKQLLTLELAIPGIYATVLKLVTSAPLVVNLWLGLTFLFWFVALGLTFFSLFPVHYQVNTEVLRRQRPQAEGPLSIEEFYYHSARRKRVILIFASISFFLGIACTLFV